VCTRGVCVYVMCGVCIMSDVFSVCVTYVCVMCRLCVWYVVVQCVLCEQCDVWCLCGVGDMYMCGVGL
jgi:hypothetical protein